MKASKMVWEPQFCEGIGVTQSLSAESKKMIREIRFNKIRFNKILVDRSINLKIIAKQST